MILQERDGKKAAYGKERQSGPLDLEGVVASVGVAPGRGQWRSNRVKPISREKRARAWGS